LVYNLLAPQKVRWIDIEAVTMLEGKAVVGETDMLQTMQQEALNLAAKALDDFDITETTEIARFIKKVKIEFSVI